jgi:UDP-N-acetylmuramate--alanine ligase
MEGYKNAFVGATKVYWLPTYLTREKPDLTVLRPEDFIKTLSNAEIAEPAEMSTELWNEIQKYVDENYLALLMTAGPADAWLRKIIQK